MCTCVYVRSRPLTPLTDRDREADSQHALPLAAMGNYQKVWSSCRQVCGVWRVVCGVCVIVFVVNWHVEIFAAQAMAKHQQNSLRNPLADGPEQSRAFFGNPYARKTKEKVPHLLSVPGVVS